MQQTTLTSKGQVTIPKSIRDLLHLYAGDKIEFVATDNNEVILRPITKKTADVFGKLACEGRKTVSVEQMNVAIHKKMREKF